MKNRGRRQKEMRKRGTLAAQWRKGISANVVRFYSELRKPVIYGRVAGDDL